MDQPNALTLASRVTSVFFLLASMHPTGAAAFNVVHTFSGGSDGGVPYAALLADDSGNLYGTTLWGGDVKCGEPYGCGTIFKIAPDGTETVLHTFEGATDGAGPHGRLIQDPSGNLYGTTTGGGNVNDNCSGGCGIVYKLSQNGTFTTLYAFGGGADGAFPLSGLILDSSGSLYGTAAYGGTNSNYCGDGGGVVFKAA